MKIIAVAACAAVASAAEGMISDYAKTNSNYDSPDPGHHYYGSDQPASPALIEVPQL